jgi:predicted TIM-barrel fold metal-dependent hydrolase
MIDGSDRLCRRDAYFAMLCQGPEKALATADEVLGEMDLAGIGTSVVFGYAFKDLGLCREANDYVIEAVKQHPDRLVGFCCVPPRDPGMEKEVFRCKDAGLLGIGELFPDGQDFDLGDASHTRDLAGVARESGLCLFLHSNELVGHHYPGKGSTGPERAWAFCSKYPDIPVILAHWGGGLAFYELMPEVRRALGNVYYDTAADPFLYEAGVYRVAREAGVLHKVLLGTDYPLLKPGRYLRRLEEAGLTPGEQRMVGGENARGLLAKLAP